MTAGEKAGWCRARAATELEVAGDVEAAAELARAVRDELPAGPARALARRTLVSAAIGTTMSYEEALSELSLALEDAAADDVAAATVHLQLADMTMTIWRIAESREHLEAAVALGERAGAEDVVTAALSETGFLDSMCGLGVTASALRAYDRWDGGFVSANAYSPRLALACARMHAGEFDAAAAPPARRDRGGRRAGPRDRRGAGSEPPRRGRDAFRRLGGRARRRPARRRARASGGERADQRGRRVSAGYVQALLGDHEAARAVALDGLARTEAMRDVWYETSHRGVLGLVALAEDDAEGAIAVLEPAWARMQEAGIGNPSIFPVTHVLGEAYAAAGRLDDAARGRGGPARRAGRRASVVPGDGGPLRGARRLGAGRPRSGARGTRRSARGPRGAPRAVRARQDDARPGTG